MSQADHNGKINQKTNMAYVQDEKSTGLDNLPTPDVADLVIMGDVSDSGRAKATTFSQFAASIVTIINTIVGSNKINATAADTTASVLDDKIELVSANNSVAIVKTIQNPGANEKISYDLAASGGGGGGGGGTKLAIDTNEVTTVINTTITAFTIPIPGGTLGTNDAIRFAISVIGDASTNMEVLYGGQSLGVRSFSNAPDTVWGTIIADGSTSAQKTQIVNLYTNTPITNSVLTVTSSTQQDLTVVLTSSGGILTAESIIVEAITSATENKKVGVGEISDIDWFNIQYPWNSPSLWTNTGTIQSQSLLNLGLGEHIFSGAGGIGPDVAGGISYAFNTAKQAIFQLTGLTANAFGGTTAGFGFDTVANRIYDSLGTNNASVGFIVNNTGQWFARCANGAGRTETAISISNNAKHVFRVEYDPSNVTPHARFYVDGILLATVTTNVPSAVGSEVLWSAGGAAANNSLKWLSCPSFAFEQ